MKRLMLATATIATLGLSPALAQDNVRLPVPYPFLANNADSSAPGPETDGATRAQVAANQHAGQFFSDETTLSDRAVLILQRIAIED